MRYLDRFFEPEDWQQGDFTNRHGKKIRYGHAKPKGEAKGTVLLTTGYADFIESYHETINDYLDRGYNVWIMDWAGQGGSDKKRSDAEKAQVMEDHIEDLRQFRQQVVQPVKDKPVILSTHSMGGQIGLHYLSRHGDDFDFSVMAAPLVDLSIKGMARTVLQAVFKSAVGLGFGDTAIRDGRKSITQKAAAVRRQLKKEDPVRMDLHKTFFFMNRQLRAEDPTFGLVDSLFEACAKLNEEIVLKSIKTPIILGLATEDDLVDNEAIRKAARTMPNARLVEIEGATHSIWHERQKYRLQWWQAVDGFLDDQQAAFAARKPQNDNNDNDKKPPSIASIPKKPGGHSFA